MEINELLNVPFTFKRRKNYTTCDSRPLWKSCLIVLVIGIVGKNNAASLKKIHVANWILKNRTHLSSFIKWEGKADRKRPNIRFDPAIDRVVDILIANHVLEQLNGRVALTDAGIKLYTELDVTPVFLNEKEALRTVKPMLTDAAVDRLLQGV